MAPAAIITKSPKCEQGTSSAGVSGTGPVVPLFISAIAVGVLFATIAVEHPWLPPLTILMACIAAALDRWLVLSRSGAKAASRWQSLESPAAIALANDHGVRVIDVLDVPLTGAFWIHASSSNQPTGYLAIGNHVAGEHFEAVVTHELGHAKGEHLKKRARATVIAITAGFIPASIAPFGAIAAASSSVLALFAASVLFCAFCRRQELAADRFAAEALGKNAVLRMLEVFEPYAAASGLWELHPPMSARRSALRRLAV